MRILMVTPRFFPHSGGVESHVYEVARRLVMSGADVTVLTADAGGRLAPQEYLAGINVLRQRAWPEKRDYYFAPGIWRIVQENPWDLMHVQSYHTLVPPLAMLAARRARVPYVLTFHGGGHSSKLRTALRSSQRALLRPLIARARRLIAVARFEIDLYAREMRLPQSRFAYIPNGSDLPVVPRAISVSSGPLIVSVGRLERYKGHQRVLAAMPYVLAREPSARLWIAGTGPFEADLRRQAAELDVADHVLFRAIPSTDRLAMASELAKADLFTLLSESETHPIAVLEALSLGIPALVANTQGLSELAEQGLAQAIPLNSTSRETAAAMLRLLRQPAPPAAVQLPTWDECAASILDLYRSVLAEVVCVS